MDNNNSGLENIKKMYVKNFKNKVSYYIKDLLKKNQTLLIIIYLLIFYIVLKKNKKLIMN